MINNKKIVLTGANSGIGLEVLKLLVQGDNKILAVDLHTDKLETFDKEKVVPMVMDVSKKENVDLIFDRAIEVLGDIDIFYANAGYPYYELFDYTNWERVGKMFETNVFSPIYSYSKYVEYLNGRNGQFAITVSAIGTMAVPGYTIYSASKFAMNGFQEGVQMEIPKNVKLTCLYPIATDTGFFKKATEGSTRKITERPFPVQSPKVVARRMVKGLEKGKKKVNPSKLFVFAKVLMAILPPVKWIYLALEKKKLERFLAQKESEQKA